MRTERRLLTSISFLVIASHISRWGGITVLFSHAKKWKRKELYLTQREDSLCRHKGEHKCYTPTQADS